MPTHSDHPQTHHEGTKPSDLHCEGERLKQEGRKLREEAQRLLEEAHRLDEQGKHLEEEGDELEKRHHPDKDLFIFVNRLRFDEHQGVKHEMSVNVIAALVGLTAETAIVRRLFSDGDASEPLSGNQHIKAGEQFSVTRKHVNGGLHDRVEKELSLLKEGSQKAELIQSPSAYVIYKDVTAGSDGRSKTDVIVPIPDKYPAHMIDRAGLPEGSPLIPRVQGDKQELITVEGQQWRMMSYHPHNGGGGPSWDPAAHGFHTYLTEIISWLGVLK